MSPRRLRHDVSLPGFAKHMQGLVNDFTDELLVYDRGMRDAIIEAIVRAWIDHRHTEETQSRGEGWN